MRRSCRWGVALQNGRTCQRSALGSCPLKSNHQTGSKVQQPGCPSGTQRQEWLAWELPRPPVTLEPEITEWSPVPHWGRARWPILVTRNYTDKKKKKNSIEGTKAIREVAGRPRNCFNRFCTGIQFSICTRFAASHPRAEAPKGPPLMHLTGQCAHRPDTLSPSTGISLQHQTDHCSTPSRPS